MITKVKWKNQLKDLCVICDKLTTGSSYWICKKCYKACEITRKKIGGGLSDLKSVCCKEDVINNTKLTCSDKCHSMLITLSEKEFGQYKKITDTESGEIYRVPTKYIIEKGLNHDELLTFPKW